MRDLFNLKSNLYCLDTNVFIQAWNNYYSPAKAASYWEILDDLAKNGLIFSPVDVKKEIEKSDDDLKKWIKKREYFFRKPDERVTLKVGEILAQFSGLVDNVKGRSLADPWVIALAEVEGAIVVTKEGMSESDKKIRIPDVCKARGIECIDDFTFIDRMGIKFSATKK